MLVFTPDFCFLCTPLRYRIIVRPPCCSPSSTRRASAMSSHRHRLQTRHPPRHLSPPATAQFRRSGPMPASRQHDLEPDVPQPHPDPVRPRLAVGASAPTSSVSPASRPAREYLPEPTSSLVQPATTMP